MEDKDLKEYLNEHFTYEIKMLHFTAIRRKKYIQELNEYGIFMSIECFLSHGRNLLEFFYYKPTNNYARATHFVDNSKWEQNRPKKTRNIIELEKRTSKEIAHLTFDRISGAPPEKQWDIPGCFSDLMAVAKCFLNLLPSKFCGEDINYLKMKIDKIKI